MNELGREDFTGSTAYEARTASRDGDPPGMPWSTVSRPTTQPYYGLLSHPDTIYYRPGMEVLEQFWDGHPEFETDIREDTPTRHIQTPRLPMLTEFNATELMPDMNDRIHATGSFENHRQQDQRVSGGRNLRGQSTDGENVQKEQEECRLLELKEKLQLPWKEIRKKFEDEFQKTYSIPALHMRYRRLRRRRRLDFKGADEAALVAAYEYWETKRWNIICDKMSDFGAIKVWTPKACAAAWTELQERAKKTSKSSAEIED